MSNFGIVPYDISSKTLIGVGMWFCKYELWFRGRSRQGWLPFVVGAWTVLAVVWVFAVLTPGSFAWQHTFSGGFAVEACPPRKGCLAFSFELRAIASVLLYSSAFISSQGQSSVTSSRHCLNDVSYAIAAVSVASAALSLIRSTYWNSLEPSSEWESKYMIPKVKNEDIHCCRLSIVLVAGTLTIEIAPFLSWSISLASLLLPHKWVKPWEVKEWIT